MWICGQSGLPDTCLTAMQLPIDKAMDNCKQLATLFQQVGS